MKTRFNTFDIVCALAELKHLVGHRVNQIYDIDNKTYLIRLHNNDEKNVLLMESGSRIHTTAFEWNKSVSPSGFTMKLRKHLKNKRLEKLEQMGSDRIIDLQFGSNEAAYHVILELYDRGNIILCDYTYLILNVLRPHTEGEELRFAVRETYPLSRARETDEQPNMTFIKEKMKEGKPGDTIRTILNPHLPFGASLIDHCLIQYGLVNCKIGGELKEEETPDDGQKKKKKKKNRNKDGNSNLRDLNFDEDFPLLMNAINEMYTMMKHGRDEASKGYLVQKKESKPSTDGNEEFFYTNIEFQPYLYNQYLKDPIKEFPSFLQAVDEFFSSLESQKIDLKAIQQERDVIKKLTHIRNDHTKRIDDLAKAQQSDRHRAELITRNQILVDSTIYAMRSLIAKQLSWTEIKDLIKERQEQNDPIAVRIRQLKLEINHISLYLEDPYQTFDEDSDEELEEDEQKLLPMVIDIDLSLTAFSNATRYYEQKRTAAKKEQKTIEASDKALKSAERKTKQALKDVKIQTTITKARKTYWFEKFYWFISSENFLIIGGRDQQQNELIVKRYMRDKDIYVHAEIQGASSIVIKNPTGVEIPPKTLLEAGTMAISYSVAWEAKVVTSAYWVRSDQVSKTAPTGEYLSTGSFMIRGKKNFLPPYHLILGLSFLFKLEDGSVERHKGERRIRKFDDDASSVMTEPVESIHEDEEIKMDSDSDENDDDKEKTEKLQEIPEEIEEMAESVSKVDIEGEKFKESDTEDDSSAFPDTHIKVEHHTGNVDIQPDPKLERMLSQEEETTLVQAAPLRVKKMERKLKPQKKNKQQQQLQKEEKIDDDKNVSKRGQKGKMKKMKEKYKDQDDEERAMVMEILKSAGSGKDSRKTKKQEEEETFQKSAARNPKPKQKPVDEVDDTPVADELDMLDSLTGIPMDEDELLFAVPVVAPYQTLQNYKYKVKLTPGTGKRGKASKTAVQIFLKDKTCSNREKDLLKSVRDEILARNIPGKVKLSAPQLMKVRK